jgi:hypothetical protein
MNLSLKEVENMTSIRMNYIKAIEEGQGNQLISPVYAQGFVKQYATFLGLDGDRLIQDNPQMFGQNAKQEFSYGIGTLEVRATGNGGVKWIPNAVWVSGGLVFLFLAWLLGKYMELF